MNRRGDDSGSPAERPIDRLWLVLLLAAGALLLLLRLLWLSRIDAWTGKDIFVYMTLADSLAAGRGFVRDYVLFFWHPYPSASGVVEDWINPLLPMMMAPFVKVLGREPIAYALPVLLFHSFGLPLAVRQLARQLGAAPYLAFLAGLVGLFQPDLMVDGSLPVTDVPLTVFLALSFAAALAPNLTARGAVMTGVWLGLAALTKPSANLFLPILVLSLALRGGTRALLSREAGLFVLAALLVQAPWLIRNTVLFGDPLHTVYRPVLGLIGQGPARQQEVFGFWWDQTSPTFLDRYQHRSFADIFRASVHDLLLSSARVFVPGYRIGPFRWPIAFACLFAGVGLWQSRRGWHSRTVVLLVVALVLFNALIWFPVEVRYFYPVRPVLIVFGWLGFDRWLARLQPSPPRLHRRWLLIAALPWVAMGSQVLFEVCPRLNDAINPRSLDELTLYHLIRERTPPRAVILDDGSSPRACWYTGRPAVYFPRRATVAELAEVIEHYDCRYAVVQQLAGPNLKEIDRLRALGWTVEVSLPYGDLLRHPDAPPLSPSGPAP